MSLPPLKLNIPPLVIFDPPHRFVDTVFLHCSASDNPAHDDVSVIRKWHTTPPRNWADVGYHYFIKRDGTIQPGRPLEKTPAAQAGHNSGTIAICLHGLEKSLFSPEQYASVKALCRAIDDAYRDKRRIRFRGHREVDPHKTCPVFDYQGILGLDEHGYIPRLT